MVFRILLVLFILNCFTLSPLDIIVISDAAEMVRTKKILFRFDFSKSERFLYREMLRFSCDNPNIKLKYWKSFSASKSEYVRPFRQFKRVFIGSFDLEVFYESNVSDDKKLLQELAKTTLAISYVSLTGQQQHAAGTTLVSLADSYKELAENEVLSSSAVEQEQVTINRTNGDETVLIDDEISYLQQLASFSLQIHNLFTKILRLCMPWISILILMALLFFMILKMFVSAFFTRAPGIIIAIRGLSVFSPIIVFYWLVNLGVGGIRYFLLGIYCLALGLYLFFQRKNGDENSQDKLYRIIGHILLIISVPLLFHGLVSMVF